MHLLCIMISSYSEVIKFLSMLIFLQLHCRYGSTIESPLHSLERPRSITTLVTISRFYCEYYPPILRFWASTLSVSILVAFLVSLSDP